MGLIRAAAGALGGTLADQWKEFFYCDAMDKDIPYFAINIPNDTCLNCGYTDEINDSCPICGSEKIQRLRRVTGYLTGDYKTAFNKGKQQETESRAKHTGIKF